MVDLGLLLELKSDLGREKVGDHWFKVTTHLQKHSYEYYRPIPFLLMQTPDSTHKSFDII